MKINTIQPLKYSVHTRMREFHLKRLLYSCSGGHFLDAGCGLGYLTEALGGGFMQVGVDRDINAILINSNYGLKNMIQADVAMAPFKEKSFDVIICSEVLEHMPQGIDEYVLTEMARILKPGGQLLVTVPSLEGKRAKSILRNLGHNDPSGGEYHYRSGYTWPEINEMVKRIPMLIVRRKRYAMFFLSELFMDILKLIYLKKNKLKEHSDIIMPNKSYLFHIYQLLLPLFCYIFICEDILLASIFKGHILILSLERV